MIKELSLRNQENAVTAKQPNHDYIHAATSNNTRKAYQSDIRHFMRWGGQLPTSAEVVIDYLKQHAIHLNPRTLARRLTALKNWHRYQGFSDPTTHPAVRKTFTGIKNIHGTPKMKAPAMSLETLATLINYLQITNRLIDIRNSALLQVGFFGAFRRSELVAIKWEHIHFVKEGMEILVPRSKTDQEGEGEVCAIPYGNEALCPVTALLRWQETTQQKTGYVFQRMDNSQHVLEKAIAPNQINIILKSIAHACQLPYANEYSAHSLRRGFATEATKNGASLSAIMSQGRWQDSNTVLGYIEEGERFEANAASKILDRREPS